MNVLRSGIFFLASTFACVGPLGAATIVLGGYPDQIQFIDDTNGNVVDKVTMQTGLPTNIQLSADGRKIYVMTLTKSGLEVLDAATHRILSRFALNTPTTKYRFASGMPDSKGKYFYATGWQIDKEIDRYRFSKKKYIVIDIKSQKVIRTADMAEEDQTMGFRAALGMSPDDKTLYIFDKTLRLVDTGTLKAVKRIDLATPDTPWQQDVSMGGAINTQRDARHYTALFESEDPYIHNKVFGVARFDLATRKLDFHPIGSAPKAMQGLQVSPDGKDGYAVAVMGEYGSQRCEFWHFDLTTDHAVNRAEFPCRRRFYFGMSANGQKLYIYGAGYDIAVYDAKTLQYQADWELRNDITMAGLLTLP